MNLSSGRLFAVLALVFLTTCVGFSATSHAQGTITNLSVLNQSGWDNVTLASPPGNGSGIGTMRVAVWNAASDVSIAFPVASVPVTGFVGVPLPHGQGVTYTAPDVPNIGPLVPGDYQVLAWIDSPGAGAGTYNQGEPRSAAVVVTIASNDVAGVTFTVVDDSDGDTLPDWWEAHWFTNRVNKLDQNGGNDTDNDGLSNSREYEISQLYPALLQLNPDNWDTDGDRMDDAWEFDHYAEGAGTDPCTPDAVLDPDGDGLSNWQEYCGVDGQPPRVHDLSKAGNVAKLNNTLDHLDALNPIDIDTDNDGLIDSFEAAWYDPVNGIDPNSAGNAAADPDQDGLSSFREQCLRVELRQGGSNDIWTLGPAHLPTTFNSHLGPAAFPAVAISNIAVLVSLRTNSWTDPSHGSGYLIDLPVDDGDGWDTDGDGLPDGWEVEFNLDPRNSTGGNGFMGNPDGDHLVNIEEYNGQDGDRASVLPYINGTGDETSPREHNWRPLSTSAGSATTRADTLGSARPTTSVGVDRGLDTDDDGIPDDREFQVEYEGGRVGAGPVHSMDPFVKRCAIITDSSGMRIPDPEGGFRPDLCSRDWTFECQVKIMSTNRSGYLFDMPSGAATNLPFAYRVSLSNDVPVVSFYTIGGYQYSVEGLALPTNTWVHIAATWEHTNNLSLYVGGIFVQEKRVYQECETYYMMQEFDDLPTGPTNFSTIGKSPDGSFTNQVYIDEVRIWTRARSATDIESNRTELVKQDSPGLAAYYRFDDGGTTAEDFTRKAKNGLLGAVRGGDYLFGDFGYALATNAFAFVTNDYAFVRGVDAWGADDSDGDGMPDGWEMINHLDPFSATGDDGADGDPDGDGLTNIYEYWAHTNPHAPDTDGNSTPDGDEDYDGDGLRNIMEQYFGSRPDIEDTDDDCIDDGEEVARGESPVNPTDPVVPQAVLLGGSTNDYLLVPAALKQRLSSWTLEAWVNPTTNAITNAAAGAGKIVERIVAKPANGTNIVNFVLGLETNAGGLRAYAGFVPTNGTSVFVRTMNISTTGAWTHLAASYDGGASLLTIYTNGVEDSHTSTVFQIVPRNGKGGETSLRIGQDLAGLIDEVRIWNDVRTSGEIGANYATTVAGDSPGLIHYFRFDDGGTTAQDFTETDDWKEEWRHAATFSSSNVVFAYSDAIKMPPTLTVILVAAAGATTNLVGAQWTLDGYEWYNSGKTLVSTEGSHTITYKSIVGWTAPFYLTGEGIFLNNNQATNITRTYLQNGNLRVLLGPPGAASNGAWQVDGGPWQTNGAVVADLEPGNEHTVYFRPVTNYITPGSLPVTINQGQTTTRTVTYPDVQGSARVFIEPAAVVSNGAQWRLSGLAWTNSGSIVSNLTAGNHTVEFSFVGPQWSTPTNIVLNVVDNSPLAVTGRYTQVSGIQVIIGPPEIVADTRWRVDAGDWQTSGTFIPLSPGSYTVGFKPVDDWIAPGDLAVVVTNEQFVLVQASYYDVDFFGADGTGVGQLRQPRGLAIADRYLYVADSGNHRIQILDTLTSSWTTLGSYGTRAGQFNQPFGVALDPSGNLWVADAGNHRVQRRNGITGAWTVFGSRGSAVGQFIEPFDIESDSAGNIYVTDHYNHRVQKRSVSGAWSVAIGNGRKNGFVRFPNGLGIDAGNSLYVSDYDPVTGVSRVQKFTNGVFSRVLGMSGGAGNLSMPRGIAACYSTNVYVADTGNRQVQACSGTSSWSVVLGSMLLGEPHDVAVDTLGDIYISDVASNRILRLPNHAPVSLTAPYLYCQDASGQVFAWNLNTNGTFKSALQISPTNSWQVRGVGDIDKNGIADSIWQAPTGESACWFMNTNGTFLFWTNIGTVPIPLLIRGAGDIDKDGIADIVLQMPTGQTTCWFMNTNGTPRDSTNVYTGTSTWQVRGVGDIDTDGIADLVWQGPTGQATCWFMKTNGTMRTWKYVYSGTTSWQIRGAGNIDGDGIADLVWQAPTGQATCWFMRTNGTSRSWTYVNTVPTALQIRGVGF